MSENIIAASKSYLFNGCKVISDDNFSFKQSFIKLVFRVIIAQANHAPKQVMCSGNSSVGRARPCQGRGRRFESGFPLHFLSLKKFHTSSYHTILVYLCVLVAKAWAIVLIANTKPGHYLQIS